MDINSIKALCMQNAMHYTNHFMVRILWRKIDSIDVIAAIMNGKIIQEYPDDHPYPSCLILGRDRRNRPIHAVCGASEEALWLITAYRPDLSEWENDWATRRRDTQ